LVAIKAEYAPVRLGALAGEIELGPDFDAAFADYGVKLAASHQTVSNSSS
jgi:hypothetical protein